MRKTFASATAKLLLFLLLPFYGMAQSNPDVPDFKALKGTDKQAFMERRAEAIGLRRGVEKDKPFDPAKRMEAVRQMETQKSTLRQQNSQRAASLLATWTELGPNPIPNGQTQVVSTPVSGRVTAIAIHPTNPNIVYVGTAQGGLYRSLNGGTTWTTMMDNAQSLAIGALALAPSSPDILYVGTGEQNFSIDSYFGVGLYRIDNASSASPLVSGPFNGATNNTFLGRAISEILVHPTDPATIFVSSASAAAGINGSAAPPTATPINNRGIYRSTNGTSGAPTFTQLPYPFGNQNLSVRDMVLDPLNPNLLVAVVVANGGGIIVTNNALDASPVFIQRTTWSSTSTNELTGELAIQHTVGNPNPTIYAATGNLGGRVLRSTDGGVTWPQQIDNNFCTPQCFYDIAVAVDPTDPLRVYIGGAPTIVFAFSVNGGTSFTESEVGLHVDSHVIEVSASNPAVLYFGSDGGIYKSTNSGLNWTHLNTSTFRATQFMGLSVHPTDPNFTIGGTQDNGTNMLKPDGTWTRIDFGDGGYSVIDQNATNTTTVDMYHTYFNASNLTAYAYNGNPTTAFENWTVRGCNGGVPNDGITCTPTINFYAPLEQGPGNPNTIYYGADRLYRSADKGNNHTTVSQTFTSPLCAIGISPQNDNVRIIGLNDGRILGTTTGANPLIDLDPTNTIPNFFIGRAVIDPNNINTAYVTLCAFNVINVWKTTNLNAATPTWTAAATGIPQVPVNAFIVNPSNSNNLYAGTDIGVYASTDGGVTWSPFGTGLPAIAVFDMAIQPTTQVLRIATHGRGMWQIPLVVVNNAPVVTTSAGTTSFVEGNNVTSTPVIIDGALTVTDDGATLASGSVSITGGFQAGQDVLAFTNDGSTMGNITGSYNAGTGVLTLTSAGATATVAQWQNALRSVTYTNSSNTPNTANRTISFQVNDGTNNSNIATKTVSVTATNDDPVITSNGGGATANVSIPENTTAVTDVDATDADGTTPTYSISGGADQAKFTINTTTGVLSFVTAPDFEAPTDANADNDYIVIVRATDGTANDDQTITVTVTNVAEATVYTIDIPLTGAQEVPANPSTAIGALTGTYNSATNELSFVLKFTGLIAPTTAAHFHGPAPAGVNAPVAIGFAGFPAGVQTGSYSNTYVLTEAQEAQLLCGLWYVNVHTTAYPGGEIRGQIKEAPASSFDITIAASQEVPANPSPGLGYLTGAYNAATNQLSFDLKFTGLVGPTTAAHFHAPAPPGFNAPVVVGFAGFPVGVMSGAYSNTYTLTEPQEAELLGGLWYVNIHTTVFPGGEIRGQLQEGTLPLICPPSFITYYPRTSATDLSQASQWTNDPTGVAGSSPANFSSPNQLFNLNNNATNPVVNGSWGISGGSNLILNNTNPLVFTTVANFSLGTGSTADFNGKPVTIKSTAAGTAYIGTITGSLTGASNATVERYLSSLNNRAYRLLAPSVNTPAVTGTIRANWQEGVNNSPDPFGPNLNPVPGYGTHITGSMVGANGFDATQTGQASLFNYNHATETWVGISNTDINTLDAKTGYLLFVRGDRSIDLNSTDNPLPSSNTTIRATGTLLTGTQSFTGVLGNNGFNLVTNPYASAIDWASVYGANANLTQFYTIWDPNIGSRGAYVTVGTDGLPSNAGSSANLNIQSGQAFFVQASGVPAPTVNIMETHKSTGNNIDVFRLGAQTELFTSSLFYKDAGGNRVNADGVTSLYNNSYSTTADHNDATQIANWDEDIAIRRSGNTLSIESRPLIDIRDTIPFMMARLQQRTYEWQFNATGFNHPNLSASLVDNFTGMITPVSLNGITVISFTVTSNPASSAANRFMVVFGPNTALPVNMSEVKAYQKGKDIQVEWTAHSETNLDKYEVEESTDARQFAKAATVAAKGTNNASYNWLDINVNNGSNYYRIKAIGKTGEVQYSKIVRVNIGKDLNEITVYPNPVKENAFTLSVNLPKGTYTVTLTNKLGQQVYKKQIVHLGGASTQTLKLGRNLAQGIYQLTVSGGDNNYVQQLMKE